MARCPNGTRRDKRTGECVKSESQKTKKRCPKGTRRDKKSGECKSQLNVQVLKLKSKSKSKSSEPAPANTTQFQNWLEIFSEKEFKKEFMKKMQEMAESKMHMRLKSYKLHYYGKKSNKEFIIPCRSAYEFWLKCLSKKKVEYSHELIESLIYDECFENDGYDVVQVQAYSMEDVVKWTIKMFRENDTLWYTID
jgi:hypothetical protein